MKRMVLSFNGDILKYDNGDGTVTIRDSAGTTQIMQNNRVLGVVSDPLKCKHRSTYIIYDGPDGRSYHCNECGSLLDQNFDIVIGRNAEPEF